MALIWRNVHTKGTIHEDKDMSETAAGFMEMDILYKFVII